MTGTMKAVVCYGPKDYRIETNWPKPVAGPGEVVIKVASCGICAGDVKAFHGADMFWGGDSPWIKAPVVPGHEFYGEIVELGEGAADLHGVKLGERVVAEQIVPCGKCKFCRSGRYWMCEKHDIFGFQKGIADGGMAEYMKFAKTCILHKIPAKLSHKEAAIIEPMACALHVVRRATLDFDDVVVLAGAGPLGLCMCQIIPLLTPKKFIVVDMDDNRLATAKRYGADLTLNPKRDDAIKIVKELTGGYGCDAYIEATGSPSGVIQGLQMVRKLGRFVEFSVFSQPTTVDWSVIGDRKELDIRGSHLGPYSYETIINLFERGKLTAEGIATHEYALGDFDKAMAMAEKLESIKVLLNP